MHADIQSQNFSSNAESVTCSNLVLDCDFCGREAEAVVTHQDTGKQWQACIECVDARRMRRRPTPYTVKIIQNASVEARQ